MGFDTRHTAGEDSRRPYSAGTVKRLFWFSEFKTAAKLLGEGKSPEEIKTLNEAENLFQTKSRARGVQIFNTVTDRVVNLPGDYLILLRTTDIATQKLIVLFAIMNTDSLFFDFIYEVYRGKLILRETLIGESDIRAFFKNKQAQNERIAKWTDETLNRLGRAYKGMLLLAGLLKNNKKKEWLIEKPVVCADLVKVSRKYKMGPFITAITGEAL
jgi:hypothetical protein